VHLSLSALVVSRVACGVSMADCGSSSFLDHEVSLAVTWAWLLMLVPLCGIASHVVTWPVILATPSLACQGTVRLAPRARSGRFEDAASTSGLTLGHLPLSPSRRSWSAVSLSSDRRLEPCMCLPGSSDGSKDNASWDGVKHSTNSPSHTQDESDKTETSSSKKDLYTPEVTGSGARAL
jgi:hypothetical protein